MGTAQSASKVEAASLDGVHTAKDTELEAEQTSQGPEVNGEGPAQRTFFYKRECPLSYKVVKNEVVSALLTLCKLEATTRNGLVALERACLDAAAVEHQEELKWMRRHEEEAIAYQQRQHEEEQQRLHEKEAGETLTDDRASGSGSYCYPPSPDGAPPGHEGEEEEEEGRQRRGARYLVEVLPPIFDFIPLLEVVPLALVCRAWESYLGRHGIKYIVYLLSSFAARHPPAPCRFSQQALLAVTMGVSWQEDGKELGATVQVGDRDRVKEAQGSDVSGNSSRLKYCNKFGRVEDADSDDLEVVFADGARKWFAANALQGTRRERWIVRLPPGPHWIELWIMGGAVHLQTILVEKETPAPHKMPWTLAPVWPIKAHRSECEQVALMEDGFFLRLRGMPGWCNEKYRGMTDYTVTLGRPLLPDILLGIRSKHQQQGNASSTPPPSSPPPPPFPSPPAQPPS